MSCMCACVCVRQRKGYQCDIIPAHPFFPLLLLLFPRRPFLCHTHTHTYDMLHTHTHTHTQLTIDIGESIREDNRMLSDMGSDFEGVGGLLGGSMKRLGKLVSSGGNKGMCYMVLFILTVFIVIWFLIK